jgi:ABC-type glycerol-3-phosphate transport system permease component
MTTREASYASVGTELSRPKRLQKLDTLGWIIEIAKYFVLTVLVISFTLPFFWMVTSALKDDSQVNTIPPVWFPSPAHWDNFPGAWSSYNFNLYMMNTIFRFALPSTLGVTVSSALVAYGFARLRWPGRDLLFSLCVATMMIPFAVTMVPLFITFKNLNWINSYRPLIVPALCGSPYFIFMLRQFFRTIPDELSDAARIDGAGEFGIMWRIILPLAKPALTVVALFQFMYAWNEYLGPVIYLNDQDLWPIALGVAYLRETTQSVGVSELAYPYLMAVSTIVTIPILIGFFFTQRTFIEGISLTGLKG